MKIKLNTADAESIAAASKELMDALRKSDTSIQGVNERLDVVIWLLTVIAAQNAA